MFDFSDAPDNQDYVIIPNGTVLEAVISNITVAPGNTNPNNTVAKIELQVCSDGAYKFIKIDDYAVTESKDNTEKTKKAVDMGRGKIKRILEYGRGANPESNQDAYKVNNLNTLIGIKVGIRTKLEQFISNETKKTFYNNKVDSYASTNKESGGYVIYQAIQDNQQPWQKPLPVQSVTTPKPTTQEYAQYGAVPPEPPIDVYDDEIPF